MKLEFISYDGSYPNLCSGTLVVEIDGKRVSFGADNADYPKFWVSGGRVLFDEDWNEFVEHEEWELQFDEKDYPPEIAAAMPELISVFNENVQNGCCGGCI